MSGKTSKRLKAIARDMSGQGEGPVFEAFYSNLKKAYLAGGMRIRKKRRI